MKELTPQERVKIARQKMPTQPAGERQANFAEVNLGLPILQAHQEALRCLQCTHPACVSGCPVGVKVKEFVELFVEGDILGAAAKIREDNVLPAITGRVCPQENQCEGACVLSKRFEPLGIGYLERFVADFERSQGKLALPPIAESTGKRVAIVGSGPAGLSAAGDLVQKGHEVTVFEALHEPGGVLIYGIPEFRLPKQVVRDEIENLRQMGVGIETNVVIGKTISIDELFDEEGYHAIFLATGAGLPRFLNVKGEHLPGVYSANEFLTRVNFLKADQFPDFDEPIYDCRDKSVAVIGGGNTAVDAVRTAVRLGARHAMLLYRRTESEMPARREEAQHAKEEGVEIVPLIAPIEFLGDETGTLRAARCIRMRLGKPDQSGRRRPLAIDGSEHEVPMQIAIVALGTGPNPLVQSATPDRATNRSGYIVADQESMQTSKKGVFAGGDIVTGSATVILAMGAGRKAAAAIHDYLTNDR